MTTSSTETIAIRANKSSLRESIFLSFETITEVKSALEDILSPSAASVILCTVAKKIGTNSCKKIMEIAKTKEKTLSHLSKLKNHENWGKISFENIDFMKGSGKVKVIDSFESKARKTTQPCCDLFRGFLEGFLSELFEKKINITEEKCAGKGDEHCEFVF